MNNLIGNAVKYTYNGSIKIGVQIKSLSFENSLFVINSENGSGRNTP